MNFLRRAAAAALSVCTLLTCASCGENTANAMSVDGYDVRAGIYLYYVTNAYQEAISVLREGGETFEGAKETADYKKVMKDINIDNVTAEEWIQNKAETSCATFVAIERDFERLGLTLSGEQLAAIENSAASSMQYYGEFFQKTGISEESVKDIIANSYKQSALWQEYYGEDGSVGVKEEELYDHYAENHLRIKYIEMPLKDGEGNLLKADGKAEIEKMAEDYMKRLQKKAGNEAELMEEMDFLIDEHNHYVTSLSEAAVTTTDDEGNTITTPTTPKVTTDKNGSTGETTTDATTTAPAETTTAEKTTEKTTETTTTTAKTDATGAETTETTAAVTTEKTTTSAAETTTTTTDATGYDKSKERILVVSTTAKEEEKKADETTTEPSYTPCEKVYTWAADEKTPLLKPELIKDDEVYYIVLKADIKTRMTEDDLWNTNAIETEREDMYNDEFLDMLDEMAKNLTVKRNERAFRRYKVLDVDTIGYQNALYSAYMSQYGSYGG
ncbi:MAG TPA: hypothetical protein DDX71_02470 [Ruminococcus sp.]|nr:hypothetical protein [Ruminococcus sp.]